MAIYIYHKRQIKNMPTFNIQYYTQLQTVAKFSARQCLQYIISYMVSNYHLLTCMHEH